MALETEVKVKLSDMDEFRKKLKRLNPSPLTGRHFEDNFILDYPDGQLRSRACLLRVRKTEGHESVTFKGPPKPSALFKSREELETRVESAATMLQLFEHLGMQVWFRYQKYREEYSVCVSRGAAGELKVALDATPIGDYAELEGSEQGIREVAERLGLAESQFLRESYYTLYALSCRQLGKEPGHMVFSPQDMGSGTAG